MKSYLTPPREIDSRVTYFQKRLSERGIDCALIIQTADLYYYSGTAQDGFLVIHSEYDPLLLVRKYHPRAVIESPLRHVEHAGNLRELIQGVDTYVSNKGIKVMGIEMDVMPLKLFHKLQDGLSVEFVDISMEIRLQRMIKSAWEHGFIRDASKILDQVFSEIPDWLSPGISELNLAGRIEARLRTLGHQGTLPMRTFNSRVHYGNILFGDNGAARGPFDGPTCGPGLYPAIPKGAGRKLLERQQPVFIDLVAGVGGYMADATRVYSLGTLPEQLLIWHRHCIDIQDAVIEDIQAGLPSETLYRRAIEMSKSIGMNSVFMGPEDDQSTFIAHGIGLEVDELPIISGRGASPLPAGAVIALEPKAVDPETGAVGIENTWIINDSQPEKLLEYPDAVTEKI